MSELLEILKYILPALVVLAATYIVLKNLLKSEYSKGLVELKLARSKIITPVRLQAYERMALFLERISPQTIIMRVHKPNMTANDLQMLLLKTIREEYEHNLSQQVYVSDNSWEIVKNAKEEMIKLVNTATTKLKDNASAMDLSQQILAMTVQANKVPTEQALKFIKNEIRQIF